MEKLTKRERLMKDPTVHDLTKRVLELSEDKDIVDRYYDVMSVVDVLKAEMDAALGWTKS
jgi:hypothetical protein